MIWSVGRWTSPADMEQHASLQLTSKGTFRRRLQMSGVKWHAVPCLMHLLRSSNPNDLVGWPLDKSSRHGTTCQFTAHIKRELPSSSPNVRREMACCPMFNALVTIVQSE